MHFDFALIPTTPEEIAKASNDAVGLVDSAGGLTIALGLANSEAGRALVLDLANSAAGRALALDLANSAAGRTLALELANSRAGQDLALELANSEAGRELALGLVDSEAGRALSLDLVDSAGGLTIALGVVDSEAGRDFALGLVDSEAGRELALLLVDRAGGRDIARALATSPGGLLLSRDLAISEAGRALAQELANSAEGRDLARELPRRRRRSEDVASGMLQALYIPVLLAGASAVGGLAAVEVLFVAGVAARVDDDEDSHIDDQPDNEDEELPPLSVSDLYGLEHISGRLDERTADRVRAGLEPFLGQLEMFLEADRFDEPMASQVEYELRRLRDDLYGDGIAAPASTPRWLSTSRAKPRAARLRRGVICSRCRRAR